MLKHTTLVAAALLALAGCQKEPAPIASAPPQSGNTSSSHIAEAAKSPFISVTPDTLQSCDGVVATVHWDASKAGTNTDSTEVWVGSSDTDAKLFSAGGISGEAKTDAWTRPGTHFFLKNKLDGKVLGQAVVGGSACP